MDKDFQIKMPKDLKVINVNDFGELIWWMNHLNVSPEKLLDIVNKVGNNVKEVRQSIHHPA